MEDTVAGLSGGADDYMHKPFAFEELLARIRLRLRAEPEGEIGMLEVGDLQLDLRTRRVSVDGVTAELTTREFNLLEMFMRHPETVLSREQLLSRVPAARLRLRAQMWKLSSASHEQLMSWLECGDIQ